MTRPSPVSPSCLRGLRQFDRVALELGAQRADCLTRTVASDRDRQKPAWARRNRASATPALPAI